MRKIMFYTNKPWKRINNNYKENTGTIISSYSTDIMLYSVFICGLILGSVLYLSKNEIQPYLAIISDHLISTQIKFILINGLTLNLSSFFFCVFCAYSCFGTIPIVLCSFIKGLYYSLIVSKLILYTIKGFAYFALILLPGSILSVCATIALCRISIQCTRLIEEIIIHNETNMIKQKRYLSKAGICLCLLILSVASDCLFTFLFAGLF